MNGSKIVNILLALTLVVLLIKFPKNKEKTMIESSPKSALEVIHERKSVRSFTEQAVTTEQIDILLKAAMAAPTAKNIQPWEFIVITNKDLLHQLAAELKTGKALAQVSAAIVVASNQEVVAKGTASPTSWIQDCSIASQNILLAAEAQNLGAVWIGVYPYEERILSVRQTLNLPEHIIPLNVIALGYSTGKDKPKNKWNPNKIHYNQWDSSSHQID